METRIDYILKKQKETQFKYVYDVECECFGTLPDNAYLFTKEDVVKDIGHKRRFACH